MSQPQYAIMRFAKYKGPEITNIEAHNERRKERYPNVTGLRLSARSAPLDAAPERTVSGW